MPTRPHLLACLISLVACRGATEQQQQQQQQQQQGKEQPQPASEAPQPTSEPPAPSGPAFAACSSMVPSLRPLVRPDEAPILALPTRLVAPLGGPASRNHELFDPDCDGSPEALIIGVIDPYAATPELVFAYTDDDLHVDLAPIVAQHGGADAVEALGLLIPRSGASMLGVGFEGGWVLSRVDAAGKLVVLGEAKGELGECRGRLAPWLDDDGFFHGFDVHGCGRLAVDAQTGAVTPQTGDAPTLEPARWPGVRLPPLTGAPELPAGVDLDDCERHPTKPRLDCGEFTVLGSSSSLGPADWRSQYERLSEAAGLSLTWESISWPGFDDAEIKLARSSEQGRPRGVEFIVSVPEGERFRVSQCMSMLSGRPYDSHTLARMQQLCAGAVASLRQ